MTSNKLGSEVKIISIPAAEDVGRGLGVTADGYVWAGQMGKLPVGIAVHDALEGEGVAVAVSGGIAIGRTGDDVAVNDLLTYDATGRIIPFVDQTDNFIAGIAMETVTGADKEVRLLLKWGYLSIFAS